jgi:hypothetical protein
MPSIVVAVRHLPPSAGIAKKKLNHCKPTIAAAAARKDRDFDQIDEQTSRYLLQREAVTRSA